MGSNNSNLFNDRRLGMKSETTWSEFFLALFSIPIIIVVQGYVFAILWGWFISPLFSVFTINTPQAIGVMLILSHFKGSSYIKKEYINSLGFRIFAGIATPFLVLLIGWIVKMFL